MLSIGIDGEYGARVAAAVEIIQSGEDSDELKDGWRYKLQETQRLAVGKYVLDPLGLDICNPKYKKGSTAPDDDPQQVLDEVEEHSVEPVRVPSSRVTYQLVTPVHPHSTSTLYFPIHYGAPTVKDRLDFRGLPEKINSDAFGSDRKSLVKRPLTVQRENLNKVCLYKIGPGAVAFKVVINAFESAGMQYTPDNQFFSVLWAKRATPEILAVIAPHQRINHYPGTWLIGRKDSLHKLLASMRRQFRGNHFDIAPMSYLIPQDLALVEADVKEHSEQGVAPTFIVKPCASSCGKGIKLYQGVPPMPKGPKSMVCQRYIANPLLIGGRKFDLRIYCVVTSFDPLRIYLFDEGLVRFAAQKYNGGDQDLDNIYCHLTNYSVNKTSELVKSSKIKSCDNEEAVDIKWSLTDFKRFLRTQHGEQRGGELWWSMYEHLKDIVIKTMLAVEHEVVAKLRAQCKKVPSGRCCFELYGLDIMVDDAFVLKLIEVNIMPSLATGATLDKAVKARLLAHMLTMVGITPVARSKASDNVLGTRPGTWDQYFYTSVPGSARGRVDRTDVPLLQKFADLRNSISMLSAEETVMLFVSDEELARCGGFDRIFPCPKAFEDYFPFFSHGVTRNNFLLASWEKMKRGQSPMKLS